MLREEGTVNPVSAVREARPVVARPGRDRGTSAQMLWFLLVPELCLAFLLGKPPYL